MTGKNTRNKLQEEHNKRMAARKKMGKPTPGTKYARHFTEDLGIMFQNRKAEREKRRQYQHATDL